MNAILNSRTAIAAVVTVLASVLGLLGYTFGEADQKMIIDAITSFVTLATGIYVVVRRILQSKAKA